MDHRRTKPAECSACSDKCERDLSTFCGAPVDIVSYVEKQHKPYMTVYPTADYYANEEKCSQAKDDCNTMFVKACENSYQVIDHSARIEHSRPMVSGRAHHAAMFSLAGQDDFREAPCRTMRSGYFTFVPQMVQSYEEAAFRGLYQ